MDLQNRLVVAKGEREEGLLGELHWTASLTEGVLCFVLFFLFFGCGMEWLDVGVQFPNQRLSPGCSTELPRPNR